MINPRYLLCEENEENEGSGSDEVLSKPSEGPTDNVDPVEELVKTQKAEIERVVRENKRLRNKIDKLRSNEDIPIEHSPVYTDIDRRKSILSLFFGTED